MTKLGHFESRTIFYLPHFRNVSFSLFTTQNHIVAQSVTDKEEFDQMSFRPKLSTPCQPAPPRRTNGTWISSPQVVGLFVCLFFYLFVCLFVYLRRCLRRRKRINNNSVLISDEGKFFFSSHSNFFHLGFLLNLPPTSFQGETLRRLMNLRHCKLLVLSQ